MRKSKVFFQILSARALFIFCTSVALYSAPARASGVISYGGEVTVRQFYDLSWEVYDRVDAFDPDILPWPRLKERLRDKIRTLQIEVSYEDVPWNGQPVLMLNQPFEIIPKIIISKSKWTEAQKDLDGLRRTMVHELFISVGIADMDYSESRLFNNLDELRNSRASTSFMQFYIFERKPWYVDWWYQTTLFLYLRQPYDPSFLPNLSERIDEFLEFQLPAWGFIIENFFSIYHAQGLCSDPKIKNTIVSLDGYRTVRKELHRIALEKYNYYCRR